MGAVTLVLLNAGNGDRLGLGLPKGCLSVGGVPLAERIADALAVPDPVMVVGFRADGVRAMFGNRFRYVVNDEWETTRTAGSLLRAWAGGPTLVVAADHLFGPRLARQVDALMAHPAAVLVDRGAVLDGEEQVLLADGTLAWPVPEGADVVGEVPEIFWVGDGVLDPRPDEDVFQAFNRRSFRVLDAGGAPWCEIDTPEDLARAEGMVDVL